VVGWVDEHYRTLPDREHRGIQGKSSGGYGAMVTAMLRPDLFSGLVTHAGDALFEVCHVPEFREVARLLRDHYGGDYRNFLSDFAGRVPMSRENDGKLMEMYCYSAAYSADDDGTVHLPFDVDTGALVPGVWQRWLAWDPVMMAPRRAEALSSMRAVWIDAGRRDEYFLDLGATAFRKALAAAEVADRNVRFELFDGGHGGIDYRYPLALAWLVRRLAPPA
jgi:S-formylglutathione hydrolase FrmB